MKEWVIEWEYISAWKQPSWYVSNYDKTVHTFDECLETLRDCRNMRMRMRARNINTGFIFPKEFIE